MICPNCKAPMQELFTSLVCSAECDLHEPTQRIKQRIASPDAIPFLRAGKTLKCVACGCGMGCDKQLKLEPGAYGTVLFCDNSGSWPLKRSTVECGLLGPWGESGHFWEVV